MGRASRRKRQRREDAAAEFRRAMEEAESEEIVAKLRGPRPAGLHPWFDLPPDEELDPDKLMAFDRHVCEDLGHEHFMRRLSTWDLPVRSPMRERVHAELQEKGAVAMVITRIAKGVRRKDAVRGFVVR